MIDLQVKETNSIYKSATRLYEQSVMSRRAQQWYGLRLYLLVSP